MTKRKRLDIAALTINLAIVFFEIVGFCITIPRIGWGCLIYYTEDSNALMLIASLLYSFYLICRIDNQRQKLPAWLQSLKYCSTLSVAVTLVVVITILSWSLKGGLWMLLTSGSMLYHHTLCPILALISFIFLEDYHLEGMKKIIKASSFTLLYAAVLIPLNIATIISGPYPFLMVYKQPAWASVLWIIIIIGGTFGLAKIIAFLNSKISKN